MYLSAAELLALERARLALRAYGIAVDRGRLVREAIAVLLADLDAEGEASLLAGRLRDHDMRRPDHGVTGCGDSGARRSRLRRAPARPGSRCTSTCSRARSTCCSA